MTLSKKQKAILWGTVIIVVLLLGMTTSIQKYQLKSESMDYTIRGQEYIYIYGILIDHTLLNTAIEDTSKGIRYDSFFYSIAKNKYAEIFAVLLIGLTAIITSKKK